MKIHVCRFDEECRRWGAPTRIHLSGFGWNLGVALNRESRFVRDLDGRPRWFDVRGGR